MASSDALKLAKLQARMERERRAWDIARSVITNPVVELVGTGVLLNWLVQRGKESVKTGWGPFGSITPVHKYLWLSENLATVIGGTVGAAVLAQQLGPQGIQALGQGTADVLKTASALVPVFKL